MRITESQLRLIIRQELLEVLNENNVNLLDEGAFDTIRKFAIPLAFAATTGGALGTAGMQQNQALPGEAAHQQILHTVGVAELSQQEINGLEKLTREYLASVKHDPKSNIAVHNGSGMKFDATTNKLTYNNQSTPVSADIIQGAKKYLTLSRSGKHSEASNFLGSPEGKQLIQKLDELVGKIPPLEKAVASQSIQTVSLAIATMSLIMSLILAILGADVTTNDRRR